MTLIIYTMISAVVIGFLLGVLLGFFKKIFAVKVDPKVQEVRDALSGANCGGCGYAGCDAFAEAVVKGEAPVSGCVAGGAACAAKVAAIMGVSAGGSEKKVAFLACHGTKECASSKGVYEGVRTCAAAQLTMNGTKNCAFGCIGFGDCAAACPFGAITMGEDGLPSVDREKCVGCGKCVKSCPKHLFVLINANTKGAIARCSNRSDNKPQIKKDCAEGCFKCGICAKKCPKGCIDISSGIPQIDYSQCISCGLCVKSCPDHVLIMLGK
ncbi:MAG: RnfABCDGE type electron transport complex subunit B [Treponema sp.]|nr:RnfABCDGE type electron transport complex subunit B [Treponema sp.]